MPTKGAAMLTASFFMRMDWRQDVMSFAFVETALNILEGHALTTWTDVTLII
jgi:hypothetical protein